MRVQTQILIDAPPTAVWQVFARIEDWPRWWSACREAAVRDGVFDEPRSHLRITLRPSWLPAMTFEPTVLTAEPGRRYVWEGRGGGVTGRHGFEFVASGAGTLVVQSEEFSGPGVIVFNLLGLASATRRMFEENLAGLKRAVEERAAAENSA
jgi:hypothetical protein